MAHFKETKTCPVCGIEFEGTAKAQMCSGRCRTKMVRLRKDGRTPKYYERARERGQKLPLLVIPKSMTFEEKRLLLAKFDAEIRELKNKPCQGHPRLWAQKLAVMIQEIEDKKKAFK